MKLLLITLACFALLAIAQANVISLTPNNFQTITNEADKVTLVKFFTNWCGHCKRLAPTYKEVGTAFASGDDKVNIAEVDCEAQKDICTAFGIQGYPTLGLIKNGKYGFWEGGRDLQSLLNAPQEFTEYEEDVPTIEPSFLSQYLSPENEKLVNELEHDLIEIWNIRRNALGLICLVATMFGFLLGVVMCGGKKVVYVTEKKTKSD